jgi:hypothetical protein
MSAGVTVTIRFWGNLGPLHWSASRTDASRRVHYAGAAR